MAEFESYTLQNGIRLIHRYTPNRIAHFGLIVNAGSRDEMEHEHGLAHFIEHVIFKGTFKRKGHHIIARLEDVGGELNAYTTKEETCIYGSFLAKDYQRAIELISDILNNSTFPEKELDKERVVIYDEINSYKDSPSELIFDDYEDLIFKGNPLARNILGTKKHLKTFDQKKIRDFISRNYRTNEIVLSSVGNIKMIKLISIVNKYFGFSNFQSGSKIREIPVQSDPVTKQIRKNTFQIHSIIGNFAFSYKSDKRMAMYLLNNLLGGPGLTSRLNISLREKHGFSYNIESHYTPYSDTGLFVVYFGTNKVNYNKCNSLILKEFKKLRENKLTTLQINKAKRQLIGQLAISSENNENLMLNIGKSLLIFDMVDTFDEVVRKIEAIRSEDIQEIANLVVEENRLTYLTYI